MSTAYVNGDAGLLNGHAGHNGNGYHHGNGAAAPGLFDNRLPPQNLEAERSVIGSVLLDNDVLHDVVKILPRPEMFYRAAHQLLWRSILDLYRLGVSVDAITLADAMVSAGTFKDAGGDRTLSECLGSVPHPASAKYFAEIVRRKHISRELIEAGNEIIHDNYSLKFTTEELMDSAAAKIFAITDAHQGQDAARVGDLIDPFIAAMDERLEHGGELLGWSTGFADVDGVIGGLQNELLVIVGARPSMGKTAFALDMAGFLSIDMQVPVLFSSIEMGRSEIMKRIVCSRAGVDGHKLNTGIGLGRDEMASIGRVREALKPAPLVIDDTPCQSVMHILATARGMKHRDGLGAVFVDYMQLVSVDPSVHHGRQEQVASISRGLKLVARDLKVPVIVLCQLNRAVENREDRRPRMADLRESGAIEQDADQVILVHRPEYYDANDQPGVAEVIVAKNRNGQTDTVKLCFERHLTRFSNLSFGAQAVVDAGVF